MINSFSGKYRFLSNFWTCHIEMDGEIYTSTEHAYQAAKSNDPNGRRIIQLAGTPGKAKQYGHMIPLPADWNERRLGVMLMLLRKKFEPGSILASQLLATGDEELVEGNHWGDVFFGQVNGVGENHLGKLLMQVREELRQ